MKHMPDPYDEEPSFDDSVKCCPDCERPNQFGELCPQCLRERQAVAAGTDLPDEQP